MRGALHNIMRMSCVILTLALTSCVHKELCYDHSHVLEVDVVFDWHNDPEASPKSMSLYLFPDDGGRPMRFEFTRREGGKIRITPGIYRAICLNSDTENIRTSDIYDFESFRLTTKDTDLLSGMSTLGVRSDNAPLIKGAEDERIAMSPDSIWTGSRQDILLESPTQEISIEMNRGFISFEIEIRNADNLRYAAAISGCLSTLSESLYPSTGNLSDNDVSIPFDMKIDTNKDIVTGQFLTFGHCPMEDKTHHLNIYVVMADGSKTYFTYDVTGQIHSATDDNHIIIILDDLPLPEPNLGGNGGGFKPEVNGWNQINIGIDM